MYPPLGDASITCRAKDGSKTAFVIEPVNPIERCEFDVFFALPRALVLDDLGLVEPVDCLGHRVVITVANATDRRIDFGFLEAVSVLDRQVLGGFNRSSQQPLTGVVDAHRKTQIGELYARQIILAR